MRSLRALLSVCCLLAAVPARAENAIPDFAPTTATGWVVVADMFAAPPSGPGPVMDDPAHPRISNAVAAATGKPPSFHMGDTSNPLLLPWARDALIKRNAEILGGKPGYVRSASCWPLGVPSFVLGVVQPFFFVQSEKEVLIVWQEDHEVRHIYMNVPHSANVKPSWFGESVGHYEGDTLVVDTIGMNDKTYIDHFRTPHTAQLHVVERFHLTDGGKMLQIDVHVDDPGTFTQSWNAVQRWRRTDESPMIETACEENNNGFFNQVVDPMPVALKADF